MKREVEDMILESIIRIKQSNTIMVIMKVYGRVFNRFLSAFSKNQFILFHGNNEISLSLSLYFTFCFHKATFIVILL